jgi:hypothetical protein
MIIPPQTEEPPTEPQWRDWTAETAMKSFRLPVKLLSELAGRSDATGVPVGHLVTGYLTAGLDASDAEAIAWADRAQRALTAGKRNARRKDNR